MNRSMIHGVVENVFKATACFHSVLFVFFCFCIAVSSMKGAQLTSSAAAVKIPIQRKHSLTPASLSPEATSAIQTC